MNEWFPRNVITCHNTDRIGQTYVCIYISYTTNIRFYKYICNNLLEILIHRIVNTVYCIMDNV